MKVRSIAASRISSREAEIWRTIQRERAATHSSPFFTPEYTLAVAAVRDDVEVAVLEDRGEVVGFVPFQRTRLNVGVPVGGRLADFAGPIVRHGVPWDVEELVRACRLAALHLRNVPVALDSLTAHRREEAESPYVDLSRGFDAYDEKRRAAGSGFVRDVARKMRKLEREVAPLGFQLHTHDPGAMDALLAWKSEQRRRTGTVNVLGHRWVVELLRGLCAREAEEFSGLLSTLHAGDHLVAVHLALRTPTDLHSWVPAYNPEFRRYSPGLILLLRLLQGAPGRGMTRVDLGRGDEEYKSRAMTGSTPLMDAPVAGSAAFRLATDAWYAGRSWARGSAAGDLLHGAKRRAQRLQHVVAAALQRRRDSPGKNPDCSFTIEGE